MHQGEYDLGTGSPYAVEAFVTLKDELVVTAQHMMGPESFVIEIEPQKVAVLLNEF